MKRTVLAFSGAILSLSVFAAEPAATPAPGHALHGAWRLVSLARVWPDGKKTTNWMGPQPVGLIVYDPSGWMSVQIGRDPAASWPTTKKVEDDPTDDEMIESFKSHYAYFGRFEVDASTGIVLHHIERSLWPTETASTYRRFFTLDGDRLTLKTPPAANGSFNFLVWERLKSR